MTGATPINSTVLDTLIVESALDFAILAMDLSGTLIRWSPGAVAVFGWTAQEALGKAGDLIFTLEDRAVGVPEREILKSREQGRSLDERWHLRKDQTRFWASGEMMLLCAADGSPMGLLKIVRDRTPQWLAEQRLLALARLGEGLTATAEPAELAALAAGIVRTSLNASAACYASITPAVQLDAVAIAPNAGLTAEDLLTVCQRFCRRIESHADAVPWPLPEPQPNCCLIPLFEPQGLVALMAVATETPRAFTSEEEDFVAEIAHRSRLAIERRRAERALQALAMDLERQVDQRLLERNRLWASSHDLMGVLTLSGEILEINPAWTAVLGWRDTDLLGHVLEDFTASEGGQRLREALLSVQERAQVAVDMKARDGGARHVEWSVTKAQESLFLVGRDVTDQMETEARLRQSQKMEAIGQLTGGIAHDFNNLLAGISGSLDLLRLRISGQRFEDLDRHIQAARTATQRAAALTHRLLTFARQQPVDAIAVDLNRLIVGMEELLRRTLHVRIALEFDLAGSWQVLGDPHQLENAILNLVLNARDAMPRGGRIVIGTADIGLDRARDPQAAIPASLAPDQRYGCVSVSDNGEGIPPAIVTKVFEPFFTTKPSGQGTGLGLAMVYGFVRQMGGDVEVETVLGGGTTLRLYLPTAEPAASTACRPAGEGYPRGHGERVLVVEDDSVVRATVVELLGELGYEPQACEDSSLAVRHLQSNARLDVLMTDCGLPGLPGGELAQLARKARPALPICFLTGYDRSEAAIDTLRPHEAVLTKPVGIETLAHVVAGLLRRSGADL